MKESDRITELLTRCQSGESEAEEALFEVVYDELRVIAARHLRREREGHSFQTADLVNEVYLRVMKRPVADWKSRAHFFAVAATAMRRILVDHARGKRAAKRGGVAPVLSLDEALVFSQEKKAFVLAVDRALDRLQEIDARAAQVVDLRFFGGLSVEDTATALGVSPRTVKRDWTFARAWLRTELG